jgi:hypothetical protein
MCAKELVAFTCGHAFGRSYFAGDLVPELLSRLNALEPAIPITAKVLAAEYSQRVIGLACPLCTWHSLAQDHAKLRRTDGSTGAVAATARDPSATARQLQSRANSTARASAQKAKGFSAAAVQFQPSKAALFS